MRFVPKVREGGSYLEVQDDSGVVLTRLPIDAALTVAGDLEIGAVEFKNASDDTRAKIGALSGLVLGDSGLPVAAYPIASERHLGEVGGNTAVVTVTPTVDGAAYQAGDVLGGKMTVPAIMRADAKSGVLQLVGMACKVDHAFDIDVIIFNADPSSSTFTNNNAVAVDPADLSKIVGVAHLTDRTDLGTPIWSQATNLGIPVGAPAADDFWAVAVVRGALDLQGDGDVIFVFGMLRD